MIFRRILCCVPEKIFFAAAGTCLDQIKTGFTCDYENFELVCYKKLCGHLFYGNCGADFRDDRSTVDEGV